MSKFVEANEKIAGKVVEGYKKIEGGVVEGFGKVTDKCVEVLFAKKGESVEDAKARLSGSDKDMDQQNTFSYTYSAPENQEVLNIRKKYLPQQETKLEELKRLDNLVQTSGVMESLITGVGGCLVLGLGMCLAMEVIGNAVWLGILLGSIGIVGMILAYPIYRKFFEKSKRKYAPRILELTAELTGEI